MLGVMGRRFATVVLFVLLAACSNSSNPPASTDAAGNALDAATGNVDAGDVADAGVVCAQAAPLAVYLIGDSTVASGSGWGDSLEVLFAGVSVANAALGGRSSKSFLDEGAFDAVRADLSPGDYLLIQFGHNDSKPDEARHTEPGVAPAYEGTFRTYLEQYIDEARGAGATPILITSVSRMTFSSEGEHRRTHGDYAHATRQVAIDNDVVLLDLEEHSHQVFQALGEDETVLLYAGYGGDSSDRTHFPPDKAFRVAEMVSALLLDSSSALRCELLD